MLAVSGLVNTFGEALTVLGWECNLGVVAVAALTVLVTRGSPHTLAAVSLAAIVGGWLVAAGASFGPIARLGGPVVHAVVAIALVAGVWALRRRPWAAAALAATAEVLMIAWWQPCVGPWLGRVITGARVDLAGELAPMTAYMVGMLVPAVTLAAAVQLLPRRS